MTAFLVPANYAFDSYTELVSGINDWLDRNDLSGVAGQLIALTEARLRRKLDNLLDEQEVSIASVNGAAPLPSDFRKIIRVVYDGCVLPELSRLSAPEIAAADTPTGFTIEAGALKLWPACDVTLKVLYKATIPQLTENTPTNDLLSRQPDLYFFGSLMFAEGYVANDNRALLFKGLFDEALAETERYYVMQRHAGPLIPRTIAKP